MMEKTGAAIYLWGALLLLAGAGLNGLLVPLMRRKIERADTLARDHFLEVVRRIDENQIELAQRLKEDREHATRHYEGLWTGVKTLDRRLTRLEVHHGHNHPGQQVGR